jgi:hypothetical protein
MIELITIYTLTALYAAAIGVITALDHGESVVN